MKTSTYTIVTFVLCLSCNRSETTDATDAASGAPALSAADAGVSRPSSDADPGHAAPAGQSSAWTVKYTLAPATMYIPSEKEWAQTKQYKDDPASHVGAGTMTLNVGADGAVSGESRDGPIGPAIVEGRSNGAMITATIRRRDPSDGGLSGTLVGKMAGGRLEGVVRLSEANAAVVREARLDGSRG